MKKQKNYIINTLLAKKNRRLLFTLGFVSLLIIIFSVFLTFGNLINQEKSVSQAGIICPAGTTVSGNTCVYPATLSTGALSCPTGGVLVGSQCQYTATGTVSGQCINGGTLVPNPGTTYYDLLDGPFTGPVCLLSIVSTLQLVSDSCSAVPGNRWFGVRNGTSSNCYQSPTPVSASSTCSDGGIYKAANNTCVIRGWNVYGVAYTGNPCPAGWSSLTNGPGYFTCQRSPAPTNTASVTYTCPNGGTILGQTCAYTATAGQAYSCPSGGILSGTNCVLSAISYQVDSTSVGIGSCIPATISNTGATTTCTFPLSGAPAGISYTLPAGGITASISTATGISSACTINASTLVCTGVPGTGATVGNQNAVTTRGGSSPVAIISAIATVITQANTQTGTCTPSSVTVGTPTTCKFPLTGNATNNYTLPITSITASISTATGVSSACTVTDNLTANVALTCTNVPTTAGTVGAQTAITNLIGETSTAPVTLTPASFTINLTNIGNSTDCTSTKTVVIGVTYICNFPVTVPANTTAVLPAAGFQASTSLNAGTDVTPVSGGYSPNCALYTGNQASGTNCPAGTYPNCALNALGTVLTCYQIPSLGGTAGLRNVILKSGTGAPVDKGDVTLVISSTVIAIANVSNSTDCVSTLIVTIPNSYTCRFPLIGDPGNNYTLPAGGITSSTSTATGQSAACTILNNGTAQVQLECTAIPTTDGTVGAQNVLVRVTPTGTPTDKGDVTLRSSTVIGIINISNSTDCISALIVTVPNTYTCNFPLTGDPGNTYILPTGGITAGTSTATGQSPACTITGNGTAQAALNCTSIPTTSGTTGLQNVLVKVGPTGTPTDKGDVTLRNGTIITNVNVGNSTNCTSTYVVTIPNTYTCNFPLTGDPGNTYILPTGGITAGTSTATGQSPACTILNNSTPQARLECKGIPTNGGTGGLQNVLLKIGSAAPTDKGDVFLTSGILIRSGGQAMTALLFTAIAGAIGVFIYKNSRKELKI